MKMKNENENENENIIKKKKQNLTFAQRLQLGGRAVASGPRDPKFVSSYWHILFAINSIKEL